MNTETQASKVRKILDDNSNDIQACSLEAGYCVLNNGRRIIFSDIGASCPRAIERHTNKQGRCTYLLMKYPDGSLLAFRWSEARGARYNTV